MFLLLLLLRRFLTVRKPATVSTDVLIPDFYPQQVFNFQVFVTVENS